jgi:hypothetical protein
MVRLVEAAVERQGVEMRTRVGALPVTPFVAAPAPRTLRDRPAGSAPMEACLAVHEDRRSPLERLVGIAPLRAHAQELRDRVGLEEESGAALVRLPADWTVLHSVAVPGGGVVPHLLVGPAGVFAVLPESRRDASVWVSGDLASVDGASSDALRDAELIAGAVGESLGHLLPPGVPVVPVVTFLEPRRILLRSAPRTVHVLAAAGLVPWLRSLPEICSALQVDRLADAAELPATWSAGEVRDPSELRDRFDGLEVEAVQADRRWRVTVRALAGAGGVVSLASALMIAALLGNLLPN